MSARVDNRACGEASVDEEAEGDGAGALDGAAGDGVALSRGAGSSDALGAGELVAVGAPVGPVAGPADTETAGDGADDGAGDTEGVTAGAAGDSGRGVTFGASDGLLDAEGVGDGAGAAWAAETGSSARDATSTEAMMPPPAVRARRVKPAIAAPRSSARFTVRYHPLSTRIIRIVSYIPCCESAVHGCFGERRHTVSVQQLSVPAVQIIVRGP